MVAAIGELQERLKDPDATFTTQEVNDLLDWTLINAQKDAYQTAKVATAIQEAKMVSESAIRSMERIEGLWESSPMAPTLQVVSYEQ